MRFGWLTHERVGENLRFQDALAGTGMDQATGAEE
jgi:hypothetical protein